MDQNEGVGQQDLQYIKSQLSEEERNGSLGRMLQYAFEFNKGIWSLRLAQKHLGELQSVNQHLENVEIMLAENVEKLAESRKKAILQTLEYQKRNCTREMLSYYYDRMNLTLEEYYEDIANDKIIEHEETKKLIIDGMKSYRQEKTDKLMQSMVNSSAYVAVVQLMKIYLAWKKISNASNVIEDKNLFTAISQNLEKMKEEVNNLVKLCQETPIDENGVNLKMTSINTIFNATLGSISSLRVVIDGHLQRLDIQADNSAVDGVVNALTATSQAYQLLNSRENLSSYLKWLGSASVAFFLGLAYGNYRTYKLSKEVLKDLREAMKEADDLQNEFQSVHQEAQVAFKDIESRHFNTKRDSPNLVSEEKNLI